MYTKYSHHTDEELISIAYMAVSPDDEIAFELLQRLERSVAASPQFTIELEEDESDGDPGRQG